MFAAHNVEARSFDPDVVPDWLRALPLVKPGTR
jgi:hypothetical protein